MEFCPECNFMLYTKLSHEIDGDESSALKLFNYCKNCGHQSGVISDNKSVYKRNYENDFIADNLDEYYKKSISLQDKNKLSNLRFSLRKKVLGSSLFDTDNFTKDLTRAFEKILKK